MKKIRLKKPKFSAPSAKTLRILTIVFVIVGFVAIVGSGSFWYIADYNERERINERRFWSAIENALATPSVVKTVTNGGSGQRDINAQRTFLSGERLMNTSYTSIINNPAQSYKVDIGTEAQQYYNGDNYIRYTKYESSEGTSLDEYLGQWAEQKATEAELENYQLQYAGNLISIVMFADLGPAERTDVVDNLRNAYSPNIKDAMVQDQDGEEVLVVPVTIKVKQYIELINKVYELLGYGDIGLDSESAGEGTLNGAIGVRLRDSAIVQVSYGSITEEYSNYGVVTRPDRPEYPLSYQELQQAVQQKLSPDTN